MKRFVVPAVSIGFMFCALTGPVGCGDGSDENPGGGGTGGSAGAGGGGAPTAGTGGGAAGGRGGSAGTGGSAGSGGSAGTGGSGGGAGRRVDAGGRAPDSGGGTRDGRRDMGAPADTGAAAGNDTWDSYAKGFFTSYCGSCHNDDNSGTATRDYHLLPAVQGEKAKIACGLAKSSTDWTQRGCSGFPPARQFPVGTGAKPSDADRDRLLRWIDSGTP